MSTITSDTGPRTVNLTPFAFDPANPKAQENIAASNSALEELDNVNREQVRFLRELVADHFGGIEYLAKALKQVLIKEQEVDAKEAAERVKDVTAEYNRLSDAHSEATQKLLRFLSGR